MASLEAQFKEAVAFVQNGKGVNPDNNTKLKFYAAFKQSQQGPNNTKEPSRLKIIERAKWQAWKDLGKISKDDAMRAYIKALDQSVPNWKTKSKL